MSQYGIARRCGHAETVQIYGTNVHGERERRAEWEATRLCRDCRFDERLAANEQANAAAAMTAKKQGWPALTGTEKQIAWAESLRLEAHTELNETRGEIEELMVARPEQADQGRAVLATLDAAFTRHTEAEWWIKNRFGTLEGVLRREAAEQLRRDTTSPAEETSNG